MVSMQMPLCRWQAVVGGREMRAVQQYVCGGGGGGGGKVCGKVQLELENCPRCMGGMRT